MNQLHITPIPAIDLIEGKCVRLTQGDYATRRIYAEDPVEMACRFQDMGFRHLHLVDLDGAKSCHVVNHHILKQITQSTNLIVDFGGGIKTDQDIECILEAGAHQVTCGSIAVTQPDTVLRWLERYGAEHIILGADVKDGYISINGWQNDSQYQLMPFLKNYIEAGIKHVLCTDISRDGMLQGPATKLYQNIMEHYPQCQLIASGGVSSIDDICTLDDAGISAVVFGKAIYEGHITTDQLQLIAQGARP